MTKKKKIFVTLAAAVMTIALIVGVTAIAANNYGTSADPLITLSYLNNTLTPSIKSQFQQIADTNKKALTQYIDQQVGSAGSQGGPVDSYKVVTLSNGQTIKGKVGCEFILRVGTVACMASSSPGLVNSTTGSVIENGASLAANNVYIVSIENNGIKATASTVKVLVRGNYTIG